MAKKEVKRGRGRPRNDGLPPGSAKTKKKASKPSRAPKTAGRAKALAKSPVKAPKIQTDLTAGKWLIAHQSAGVLEKAASGVAPAPASDHGSPDQPAPAAPGAVFSRESDQRPISVYAVFDSKEEAELELSQLRRGPKRADALDVAMGLVDEPATELAPIDPVLHEAEVVPMKTCFATSYKIGDENELQRTVTWKDQATPLKAAVAEVKTELVDQLKTHQAALKEFDRRVAEARKDNEMDVRKAEIHLEKFEKAMSVYA